MSAGIYGTVAEFDRPEDVLAAARRAYESGYREMEAFAPFLVEGLAEAIGFRRNFVPLIVLLCGIAGGVLGFGMQCYAAIVSYPLNVGGRPLFSWPSFIPVTFELTVLFAATGAFLAAIFLNGLPRPHHPIFNTPHYAERNHSRFYLCIKHSDGHYAEARRFLESLGPSELWEVEK